MTTSGRRTTAKRYREAMLKVQADAAHEEALPLNDMSEEDRDTQFQADDDALPQCCKGHHDANNRKERRAADKYCKRGRRPRA